MNEKNEKAASVRDYYGRRWDDGLPAAREPKTVCDRVPVESAASMLGMGRIWGADRAATLKRVRSLSTYDRATDTVVVCRFV